MFWAYSGAPPNRPPLAAASVRGELRIDPQSFSYEVYHLDVMTTKGRVFLRKFPLLEFFPKSEKLSFQRFRNAVTLAARESRLIAKLLDSLLVRLNLVFQFLYVRLDLADLSQIWIRLRLQFVKTLSKNLNSALLSLDFFLPTSDAFLQ